MENYVSDFDRRQLTLMKMILILYRNHKMSLFSLYNQLNGLLNALEFNDEKWSDLFHIKVNELEQVYISKEDGSVLLWKVSSENVVNEALSMLERLVVSKLDQYLKSKDLSISRSAILVDERWLICPECRDAWEDISLNAMVICPKCDRALHNPRYKQV